MSPHCRRHPPPTPPPPPRRRRLHLLFLLLFIIIPLFLFLLTLVCPFPSSRIDSPFRPPGHEPPLFPPPPSLIPLFSLSLSFSSLLFSFHLNIFLSQSFYLAVCLLLSFSSFLFASRSSPLYYIPRAIYPSIHLPIRAHVCSHTCAHVPFSLRRFSLSLSLFIFFSLSTLSFSRSRTGHLGAAPHHRRPSSTPHPHQPHIALSASSRSYENYVTRSIRAFLVPLSFLIFLLWISQSAPLGARPLSPLVRYLGCSSPLRCTVLPNIISGVPADLPADPERE